MPEQFYTAAFTGHREIPDADREAVAQKTFSAVTALYDEGIRTFIVGGALGYDTLAALIILKLKALYPDIRLIVAIPCAEQAARWSKHDQTLYQEILHAADDTVLLAEHYFRGCMQQRNRYMVDHADCLVAYVTHDGGGSAYTRNYAIKKGKRIVDVI